MKSKKVLLPAGLVAICALAIVTFQNCAPVNFKDDGQVVLPSSAAVVSEEKVLEIPVTSETVSAPFKVLIIVDNSASMQVSQEKIVNNLDSLLDPLQGKDVEVGITTTSSGLSYSLAHSVERNGALVDVQMLGGNLVPSVSPSISEIVQKSYQLLQTSNSLDVPVVKAKAFTRGTIPFRSSLSSQNSQDFADFKKKIKDHILSLGTKGSDVEMGLCPVLQQLQLANMGIAQGQNQFFKKNDKAAIVILSNEDDSSVLKNCALKSYEFDRSIKAQKIKDYLIDVRGLQVVVSNIQQKIENFEVKSDGKVIQAPSVVTEVLNNIESLISLKDVPFDSTCAEKAQSYLRNRGTYVATSSSYKKITLDLSAVTVSSCKQGPVVTYLERSVLDTDADFNKDLCAVNSKDQRGENIKEKIVSSGISFASNSSSKAESSGKVIYTGHIPGRYFSFITNIAPFYVGCSQQERSSSDLSQSVVINQKELSFISDKKDLKDSLLDLSEESFKGNYFYSFIVNTEECKDTLDATESIGQKYLDFAKMNPRKAYVHSICSDSYQPALQKVSQFIQEKSNSSYSLDIAAAIKHLKSVSVNGRLLAASDFTFEGGELKISKLVNLKVGDKIKVIYEKMPE